MESLHKLFISFFSIEDVLTFIVVKLLPVLIIWLIIKLFQDGSFQRHQRIGCAVCTATCDESTKTNTKHVFLGTTSAELCGMLFLRLICFSSTNLVIMWCPWS